jgi:hypothetical protein
MPEMNSIHVVTIPSVSNGKRLHTKTCWLRIGSVRFAGELGMDLADFSHHEAFQPFPWS